MDDELAGRGLAGFAFEIENNVLADAMDAGDAKAGERGGHGVGVGFEGLAGAAEFCGENALAVGAVMDAVGDGFDFGEFGHGSGLSLFSRRARVVWSEDDATEVFSCLRTGRYDLSHLSITQHMRAVNTRATNQHMPGGFFLIEFYSSLLAHEKAIPAGI